MRNLVTRFPKRFQWTIHNLVAHPLSEVLFQLGATFRSTSLNHWSSEVHNETTPYDENTLAQPETAPWAS